MKKLFKETISISIGSVPRSLIDSTRSTLVERLSSVSRSPTGQPLMRIGKDAKISVSKRDANLVISLSAKTVHGDRVLRFLDGKHKHEEISILGVFAKRK